MEKDMKKLASGTVVELSTTPETDLTNATTATYTEIGCDITSFALERTEREQIDVTGICESETRKYIDGLRDEDTITMDAFYLLDGDVATLLETAAGTSDNYILRFTKGETVFWTGLVNLQPYGFNGAVGEAMTTSLTFRVKETA